LNQFAIMRRWTLQRSVACNSSPGRDVLPAQPLLLAHRFPVRRLGTAERSFDTVDLIRRMVAKDALTAFHPSPNPRLCLVGSDDGLEGFLDLALQARNGTDPDRSAETNEQLGTAHDVRGPSDLELGLQLPASGPGVRLGTSQIRKLRPEFFELRPSVTCGLNNRQSLHGLTDRQLSGHPSPPCGQEGFLGSCEPLAAAGHRFLGLDPFESRLEASTIEAS
jgi:hypothetical protein